MRELRGKTVVITGASAGIGRAAVRAFAAEGANIGLLARGSDGLEGAKKEAEKLGVKALVVQTDVADYEGVERAAIQIEEQLGPIDVWVNNAFTNVFAEFEDITADEYRRITEVSYLGFVHGTMVALRRFPPRDQGIIIQVGSALAYRSIPLQSAYCGAKSAIRGFTDSIRCELHHKKSKVQITMVQMPALNTPQFSWCKSKLPRKAQPVPPIFEPAVAARAIVGAAERGPRELLVGWPTLEALLGQLVVPGFVDRYLGKVGYDSQMTQEAQPADAPFNLYEPLSGDHGARGTFTSRSGNMSPELMIALHPGAAAAVGVFVLGGIVLVTSLWRRR